MGWLASRFDVTRLYRLGLLLASVTTVVFGLLVYVERPEAFLGWSLTMRCHRSRRHGCCADLGDGPFIINQFPQRMNSAVSLVEGMFGGGLCLGPALGGVLYSAGGYGVPFLRAQAPC
ncbi:hypothetical protein FJT64_013766 [Amphibalanus amphitrite]|uniref:Synaptic vesicular amine transporter n=1 Tax=Amphibalanus amphitrite TaxID=1232801 RepID=A0A6A4V9H7_AMPAM|nr:hypothetical protein FJT64_013766 [Amphibalanus amphitrite]